MFSTSIRTPRSMAQKLLFSLMTLCLVLSSQPASSNIDHMHDLAYDEDIPHEVLDEGAYLSTLFRGTRFGFNPFNIIDTQIRYTIQPLVYYDSNKNQTIINLCESPIEKDWKIIEGGYPLIFDECSKGYKVIESTRTNMGIGISSNLAFNTITDFRIGGVNIGIVPIKGKTYLKERFAPTRDSIKKLKKINFPNQAKELDAWSIGDKVTYMASGGLITFVSLQAGTPVGFIFGSASLAYLAEGEWVVQIQKVAETKAHINITKSKIRGLNMNAGNFVTSIALSKFKNIDDSFSYIIDYKNPETAKIYENTVRGNLGPIQERMNTIIDDLAYPVAKERSIAKIRIQRRSISIPLVAGKEWNRGKIFRDSETFLISKNKRFDAEYGTFFKNTIQRKRTLRTSTTINVLKTFNGTRYKVVENETNKLDKEGYFGELMFSYTNNAATKEEFKKGLWHLFSATGLKDYLRVSVANQDAKGYVGIHLTALVTKKAMDRLMMLANSNHPAFNEFESMRITKYYLQMMSKYNNVNDDLFTANFMHFGRFFISNRSTFKAVLALVPDMVKLRYRVEGEKFHSYERKFTFQDLQDLEEMKVEAAKEGAVEGESEEKINDVDIVDNKVANS